MNCQEAHRALMTAEPQELRGLGESALVLHLRSCASCQDKAARLLEGTALLAAALARDARPISARTGAPKFNAPLAWPVWLPAAMAAAISALLLSSSPEEPTVPRVGSLDSVKPPVTSTVVNAPATGDVAVFKVADNVTVIWQLGAGGS